MFSYLFWQLRLDKVVSCELLWVVWTYLWTYSLSAWPWRLNQIYQVNLKYKVASNYIFWTIVLNVILQIPSYEYKWSWWWEEKLANYYTILYRLYQLSSAIHNKSCKSETISYMMPRNWAVNKTIFQKTKLAANWALINWAVNKWIYTVYTRVC